MQLPPLKTIVLRGSCRSNPGPRDSISRADRRVSIRSFPLGAAGVRDFARGYRGSLPVRRCLLTVTTISTKVTGIHTQTISLARISRPRPERKAAGSRGDVLIGRQPKKNRSSENGIRKPIPSPASVIASSAPCEALASANATNTRMRSRAEGSVVFRSASTANAAH